MEHILRKKNSLQNFKEIWCNFKLKPGQKLFVYQFILHILLNCLIKIFLSQSSYRCIPDDNLALHTPGFEFCLCCDVFIALLQC